MNIVDIMSRHMNDIRVLVIRNKYMLDLGARISILLDTRNEGWICLEAEEVPRMRI